MKLSELASTLGIKKYPAALEKTYAELLDFNVDICDADYIKELQTKYNLLGDYLDVVLRGAAEVAKDELLALWGKLSFAYNISVSSYESRHLMMPPQDGGIARDILPVLVILQEVPYMVKNYESRGFNETQILKNLDNIRINLWVCELLSGRPSLDRGHYNWLCHYTKAAIFDHKAFNFQPSTWGVAAIVLKNKASGECFPIMMSGRFHRNGLVLGSAGCEDEEGSFDAEFTEVYDAFIGHLVKDGRVEKKLSVLKKSEWECIVRPGDDVISVHIPRQTKMDPDYVAESLREGFELSKKYYPELSPKFLVCYSWLMDPTLVKILGEGAKVSSFTNRFMKYPLYSDGKSCLGYVFTGYHNGPVEEYPEKTTLQRGIKKLMLGGEYIHGTAGIVVYDIK